ARLTSMLPAGSPVVAVLESLRSHLAAPATELTLRKVDEYGWGLTTPYRGWTVEVSPTDTGHVDLLRELHASRVDRRLIGSVLYRSTEAPTITVLFLGLACGVTPSTMGFSAARLGSARIAGTLALLLELRRLTCGVPERNAPIPEFLRHGAA